MGRLASIKHYFLLDQVMLFVYLGNARELPPDAPDLQQEL